MHKPFKKCGKSIATAWEKTWFNSECEILRKGCMTIKNSLRHGCDPQYQLFHQHVKQYKKVVSKTKKLCTRKFNSDIRKLKTKNPRDTNNNILSFSCYYLN